MAERTIQIYDVIGGGFFFEGITARDFSRQLQEAKDDENCDRVVVAINSPGGSISEGIAMYNEILRTNEEDNGLTVDTRNDGIAYSMAAVILMAGQNVLAHQNTTTLLHNVSGIAMGNVRDFNQNVERMKAIDEGLSQSIANRTGKTLEEVQNEIMNYDDHTYTAQEALDLGLIDEIIPERSKSGENLQNLSMQEAMAYFQKQHLENNEQPQQRSFRDYIRNAVAEFAPKFIGGKKEDAHKNDDEPMKIKNTMAALVSFFNLNFEDNQETAEYHPSEEDVQNLNDALANADAHKQKAESKEQEVKDLQQQVENLKQEKAELEKGSDAPPNPKKEDHNADQGGEDEFLSEADIEARQLKEGVTDFNSK